MNFHKTASKQQKGMIKKKLFKQIQIFLSICPFQTCLEKQTFGLFQCSFLRQSLLCLNTKVHAEFSQNCFKTTERHSLAVCGSIVEKNNFCQYLSPFTCLIKKNLFKQIQIFRSIQTWLEKQTFGLFQCSFLRQSLLCLKTKVQCEFPQNCFQTTERQSLAVCGSLCGEKLFLLIFIPFYLFD